MPDNSSFEPVLTDCSVFRASYVIGHVYNVTKSAFVIPLYIFIVYLGVRRWRQQRSFNSASHSDVFTYHVVAFELIWLLAKGLEFWTLPSSMPKKVANYLVSVSWYGETFVHVLTCAEQYLAVVHPIIYMRQRNAQGARIRNISIVCVWVFSVVFSSTISTTAFIIPFLVPFAFCLVAVSFFSLSVLYVLVQPRPGEGAKDTDWVDQTKQRAFFTIAAIMVVLWLWFGGFILAFTLLYSRHLSLSLKCLLLRASYMFNLPSSTVLPLLYLHRVGKLSFCFCRK